MGIGRTGTFYKVAKGVVENKSNFGAENPVK